MSGIRALIADDEPLARKKLRSFLEREPDVEVVGEGGSGPESVARILELEPDLVFLDVEMPGLDGLSVLESLGERRAPLVIFVTAYEEYAVRAFEVKALDYLLKPVDRPRFRKALERARDRLRSACERGRRAAPMSRLMVRSGDRVLVLKLENVDWIEAADNYVRIHSGGRAHLLRGTLTRLQQRLDPTQFVRIHRKAIVNVDRIQSLYPLFHGDQAVVLQDGTELTLSRRYRALLEALLGKCS